MSTSNEQTLREDLARAARSLFTRGLTHGSTGNIGVRTGDHVLVTPTGRSLGDIEPDELSLIDLSGTHLDGPSPTKEAFLHAAMLRARPQDSAVVHTHSTYAAAVSCLDGLDPDNALPPLTAYYVMRAGRVPLLPFHAPGDDRLGALAESAARTANALLLSNHGPIVAARSVQAALDAVEEIEETAKLFLLLRNEAVRLVAPDDAATLRAAPSR
jgi:3-dehydro-4-phosphotetronate decarboxylase